MSLTGTLGRDEERIVVGGKEYRLCPPTLGAYLAAERELRRHLGTPLRLAAECARHIPPEHAAAYWSAAHAAEREQADRTLESMLATAPMEYRMAAVAMLLLHRHHGSQIATLDDAAAWVAEVNLDEFDRAAAILMPPPPNGGRSRPTSDLPTGQQ